MIRVAQHQRGGSFMRISWDPRISVGDNVVVDTEVRANFCSHEVGSLDELIELLQAPSGLACWRFSGGLLC
jgi:hypothetical protein